MHLPAAVRGGALTHLVGEAGLTRCQQAPALRKCARCEARNAPRVWSDRVAHEAHCLTALKPQYGAG
jgi:hypothetical protein